MLSYFAYWSRNYIQPQTKYLQNRFVLYLVYDEIIMVLTKNKIDSIYCSFQIRLRTFFLSI